MPSYATHALFSQQALADDRFALRDCCLRYANLYRFGAQGPDVFYWLHFLYPLKGYGALADKLHSLDSTAPLEALHEIPQRERARAMMCAYLCGVAGHFVLDEAAHPYIEARAADLAHELGVSESCAHSMLERRFEARHYNELTGRQASGYLYEADLPSCAAEREAIARAWGPLISQANARPLKAEALARDMTSLAELLSRMFDSGGNLARLLDSASRLARRDFSLRWLIKRPFAGENAPMTENDYGVLAQCFERAMRDYLRLMSG